MTWLLALLASVALAQNPPYTLTETKTKQDAGAINFDIRALADSIRKSNSDIRSLQSDAVSSTNTTTTIFTTSPTFTGSTIFRGSTTFYGPVEIAGDANFEVMVSSLDIIATDAGPNVATITINSSDFGYANFSSASWRIHYNLVSTNTVHWFAYFNDSNWGQSNTGYKNTSLILQNGGLGSAITANAGCVFDYASTGALIDAGKGVVGDFFFETVIGSSSTMIAKSEIDMVSSGGGYTPSWVKNTCVQTAGLDLPVKISIAASTETNTTYTPNAKGTVNKGHIEVWVRGRHK